MEQNLYRVNKNPNNVIINVTGFEHQFDPLGAIYDCLCEAELLTQLKIDVKFIINELVAFVGYTESTLHLKSTGNNFGCSKNDLEQLYFIQTPSYSKFPYTLTEFSCYIRGSANTNYCVTLVSFDVEKVKKNEEIILWQSKIYDIKSTPYKCYDYCHEKHKSDIATFDNINIKLENNKTYLIRIDIPSGGMSCGRVYDGQLNEDRECLMVSSSGNYVHNKYYIRDYYPEGKIYQVVFM
eukprot:184316_1